MNKTKENLKKTKLYQYVTSDENIFLAIYELESYIFDKELLDERNRKIMNELRDVFNEKFIQRTINKVKSILDVILLNEDAFIDVQVYFKPKAAEDIIDWFNKNKDYIYYEIQYVRNTKKGKKGEIKEKGYKIEEICYKVI